ncbi:MAG: hypothetical protein JNK69_02260 [Saprospiraceae bacterium]|nr:hypothetical protein [Candidatus Vicinibacter proximus]MBL7822208.1 hypothetical protein [Saprospiraceae bacterium]MCC6843272.1 hypothetical protein [Saprospiraceae bacterium]
MLGKHLLKIGMRVLLTYEPANQTSDEIIRECIPG